MAEQGNLGCVTMVALLFAGAWAWHLRNQDYVTIYEKNCQGAKAQNYHDCAMNAGASTYVSATEFRIDFDHQKVFEISPLWTTRYDSCRIANENNWICDYSDGSGTVRLTDGRYAKSGMETSQQISWAEYFTRSWGLSNLH